MTGRFSNLLFPEIPAFLIPKNLPNEKNHERHEISPKVLIS
jgi:hypothetical protein